MDSDNSFQFNMDLKAYHYLELEGGDHDQNDVLYAEIRKQIMLLTTDEVEDEDLHKAKWQNSSIAAKRSSNRLTACTYSAILQPGSYFNWWDNESTNSVPAWLLNLWKNANGTGVFIPQIAKSRRYYKPGMCLISFVG